MDATFISSAREVNFFLNEDSGEDLSFPIRQARYRNWDVIFELVTLTPATCRLFTTQKGLRTRNCFSDPNVLGGGLEPIASDAMAVCLGSSEPRRGRD